MNNVIRGQFDRSQEQTTLKGLISNIEPVQ